MSLHSEFKALVCFSCGSCGHGGYEVEDCAPAIPGIQHEDGEGRWLAVCLGCGEELPEFQRPPHRPQLPAAAATSHPSVPDQLEGLDHKLEDLE